LELQEVEVPKIPRHSGHEGNQVTGLRTDRLYSPGDILRA
jgi:hypothetical protein